MQVLSGLLFLVMGLTITCSDRPFKKLPFQVSGLTIVSGDYPYKKLPVFFS